MTWTPQPKWYQHSPWIDEYYPWHATNFPWLIENDNVDWTPRTPVS